MKNSDQHIQRNLRRFLELRQAMLNRYWQLLDLAPFKSRAQSQELLQQFCQLLVDYTSYGHFQIYELVFNASGKSSRKREVKYQAILSTTDAILDFNEQCANNANIIHDSNFKFMLSEIGESIAERLEIEDWIFYHRPQQVITEEQKFPV